MATLNHPEKDPSSDLPPSLPTVDIESNEKSATQQNRQSSTEAELPFSIFTLAEKRLIIFIASFTTLLPPLTGSMYYPIIPVLADDLHVSINDIGYTITAYLIVQGIAPSFIGNLSDETGRRPALIVAFIIYIAGCIGAAFKNNYALLLVMRCLQSAGSSSTIAMSLATVSDIVTSAERGSYTSYVQMGWMVGPAIGPIIGGLLSQYLGWKSIFWFLTIFASTVFIILLLFMPETSRNIVGNGSIPSARWNQPLLSILRDRHTQQVEDSSSAKDTSTHSAQTKRSTKAQMSPWSSLKLFGEKETCLLLLYSGMIYASSYVIVSTLPAQLKEGYGFNTIQISLCYLPAAFGTIISVLGSGRFLDWNFRRHANHLGMEISKQKQQDLRNFPIEIARLQITLPLLVGTGLCMLSYGWTLQARTSLAAPLIFLFLQAFGIASSFSSMNNLLLDLHRDRPGTCSSAMNLSRCWLGAGGVALGGLINNASGAGWMTVTVVGLWLAFSPFILIVLRYGPKWRERKLQS